MLSYPLQNRKRTIWIKKKKERKKPLSTDVVYHDKKQVTLFYMLCKFPQFKKNLPYFERNCLFYGISTSSVI